jgi:hypothetical protein
VFEASAKCPAYVIPDEVADAVRQKQHEEEAETAKLIAKGTPVARMNTGIDGGMNRVFAAHIPDGNTGLSDGGSDKGLQLAFSSPQRAPGTIPAGVNPPRGQVTSPDEPLLASTASTTRVASAAPATQPAPQSSSQSEGFFSSLARKVGIGSATADASATTAPAPAALPAKPKAEAKPPHPEAAIPKTAAAPKTDIKTDTKQAAARPPLKPTVIDTAAAPAPAAPAAGNSMVAGAQPIVSANSFDSRFSAAK